MRIISWSRYEVSGTADCQPPIWTAIEFEAPADSSEAGREEAREFGPASG